MKSWPRLFVVLMQGSLICAAAEAQTLADPQSTEMDISIYPWSAIGKINDSVGGSCTGVAVQRNEVLTAAHCIFNQRTGNFLHPSSLHVLFGYHRGDYTVHARVERYILGPGYDPAKKAESIASDWAMLTLTEPLPASIRPLQLSEWVPAAGASLAIAGYGRSRSHIMTGDEDCRVLSAPAEPDLIAHNCSVAYGMSGAPLLASQGDAFVVVGIQVAAASRDGSEIGLAVSLPSIRRHMPR